MKRDNKIPLRDSEAENMAAALKYTLHHYGSQNYLQKLGVWEVDSSNRDKYWVM
jgi:hypothetical protein